MGRPDPEELTDREDREHREGRTDCEELESRLPDLVEEDPGSPLPEAERDRLLAHAGKCGLCAESLRTYRRLLAELHALPVLSAPPELAANVARAIESRAAAGVGPSTEAPRARGHLLRFVTGLAALLAISAGVGLWMAQKSKPPAVEMSSAPPAAPIFTEDAHESDVREAEELLDAAIGMEVAAAPPVGGPDAAGPVIRLPALSRESVSSLLLLADSFAPEGLRLEAGGRGGRSRLISFELDPERMPELEEALAAYRPRPPVDERALAAAPADGRGGRFAAPEPSSPAKPARDAGAERPESAPRRRAAPPPPTLGAAPPSRSASAADSRATGPEPVPELARHEAKEETVSSVRAQAAARSFTKGGSTEGGEARAKAPAAPSRPRIRVQIVFEAE